MSLRAALEARRCGDDRFECRRVCRPVPGVISEHEFGVGPLACELPGDVWRSADVEPSVDEHARDAGQAVRVAKELIVVEEPCVAPVVGDDSRKSTSGSEDRRIGDRVDVPGRSRRVCPPTRTMRSPPAPGSTDLHQGGAVRTRPTDRHRDLLRHAVAESSPLLREQPAHRRVTHSTSRRDVETTLTRIISVTRPGWDCPYARPSAEPHDPPHTIQRSMPRCSRSRSQSPTRLLVTLVDRSTHSSPACVECSAHSCAGRTTQSGSGPDRTCAGTTASIPNRARRAIPLPVCRPDPHSFPKRGCAPHQHRAGRARTARSPQTPPSPRA